MKKNKKEREISANSEYSFGTITLMIADEIITEGTRGCDSKITRENLIFQLLY